MLGLGLVRVHNLCHVTIGVLRDCARGSYTSTVQLVYIFLSLFNICFVDQTSANKMVIAVLKSCIAGVLVFSFCTAGIVKITNKISLLAYEQMVSCLVHVSLTGLTYSYVY